MPSTPAQTHVAIGGRGTAAKAAEEVKDACYNKRAIIPAGTLVPVAFETYGTLGARGDAYLCDVVRSYVRPVTWLDAPADKGPKFVDHGGRGRYVCCGRIQSAGYACTPEI